MVTLAVLNLCPTDDSNVLCVCVSQVMVAVVHNATSSSLYVWVTISMSDD